MENKKTYIKPVLESETFVPQVYCINCAALPGVTKYYFECNAGSSYQKYDVVTDAGVNLTKDDRWTTNYYQPCNETHEALSNDEFLYGWMYESGGRDNKINSWTKRTRVIIWTEGGTNVHCTKNLDMDSWQVAKS